MSTLSNSRSSSATSSSSQSSTPTPTTLTSSYSCLNNPVRAAPASEATPTTLPPVPPSIPPPVTPVHPSFTLMTPTPPPSSSRPLPESPSDNKHSLNHNRNVKWRGSPLMAEITNVDDRCEEEATQLQSHSQSTPPKGQDHLDATSASSLMSSSTPVPSASPSPSSAASAVAAACSTNTPNPLQTTNVYINGLPPHFKAEQLYALTSQFGTVLSCRTFTRQLAECPSGYGFVLFDTLPAAQQCIDVLRSHHNLHPTFAKQAHKITRTPTVGTLSVGAPSTYSTSNPGAGLNMPPSLHTSLDPQPNNSNTDGGYTPYNNKSNTAYTNAASSAYIPSAMNAALGSGGVTYGVELVESEDGGADIYIEGLPPTLTPSTLRALLAPHIPRAHRFFADTRRLSDSGLGLEEDGVGPGMGGGVVAGGRRGGRTGRLVVFVRLPTRAAAHDIRTKLHGRAIRGYSARLRVSFADDLDAERERLAAQVGHEQPGPLTEHGFRFEGGGMGAHDADDGNRFGAYGNMNGNGGTCGNTDMNVDGFAAEDVFSYTDADANSVICTNNANAHPNAVTNANASQKSTQQPTISGLPVPASGGCYDPFYDGFEGSGNVLGQTGIGYGNGEWNGSFDGSGIGNLGYGQRQNRGQGLRAGNGLGTVDQVQQLLHVQSLLHSQNQLVNTPMSRYSDRLDTDTLPRSHAAQFTDPASPSPHAHGIGALSHGSIPENIDTNANMLHTNLAPNTNTHMPLTVPVPLQPFSATLHSLQLQLDSLRPLLAAYSQGGGVPGKFGAMGCDGGISTLDATLNASWNRDASTSSNTSHGSFNLSVNRPTSNSTLALQPLRPRSLSTVHAPTHTFGSASIFGGANGSGSGAGFGGTGTTLNPRAQIYAHPHAHGAHPGQLQSANARTSSNANPGTNKSSSNAANTNTNSANSNVTQSTPSETSRPSTSNSKSTSTSALPAVSSHSLSPSPGIRPTPPPGAHARAQTSTEPTPSARSRVHTTGHGLGELGMGETGGAGVSTGGTGITGLGMGLGAPLFPHPQAQAQTQTHPGSQTLRNGE